MNCPRCHEWLAPVPATCPKCGLDVSALRSLGELKSTLHRARNDSDAVAARMRDLSRQVDLLESQITNQLMPASATVPSEPQPREIGGLTREETPAAAAPSRATGGVHAAPPTRPTWAQMLAAPEPKRPPAFSGMSEARLGQKGLLIAGLVITILAVGYLLKYSFDRNWIGPAARVALGYAAGMVMLGAGEFCRRRKLDIFGLYILGGGIAVLYFASYAAFQLYALIGQLPAFGLMALVTALAGLLSLAYDTKWLAVLGIIGGFLTPVVLSTATDNQIALMTYMAVLNGGILAVAVFKQWDLLNYLGLTFTWLLFSGWYVSHYANTKFWTTTVFLNLFFLTYAVVPFVYYFVRTSRRQVAGFGITIPNAFVAFAFSYLTIRAQFKLQWVSVATAAYAGVFLAMATFLHRRKPENLQAFTLLLAKGLLFLIITVPLLFSAHWITIFWAAQAIVLLWAGLRLRDRKIVDGGFALLLITAVKLVYYDYARVFHLQLPSVYYFDGFTGAAVERWVTVLLTLGALLRSAQMLRAAGADRGGWYENPAAVVRAFFAILLFLALNIEVAAGFHDYLPRARPAAISVLWAFFASGMMVLGFARNWPTVRACAIILFAATILKVFLRDMADVNTPYRIMSFLVLGLMLVGASYLYHRYKGRILPMEEKAEA